MVKSSQSKKVKIGHLNVRSLFTGFEEFSDLVLNNNFDIMCVSETWLNKDLPSDIVSIPNYSFFRKDRLSRGGGVGIYVRNNLNTVQVLNDSESIEGVEHIWIELKTGADRVLIGVIYRAPSNNINHFLEYLDNLVSYITPQFQNILILGDLNVDQLYNNPVSQCMTSYDFQQLIKEPTRITNTSQKIIDVIFANNYNLVIDSGTINAEAISDHSVVFCELNMFVPRPEPIFISYRNFKNFNKREFDEDLNNIPWENILYLNNIEDKIELLNSYILELFDTHAPYITSRISKPYAPWLTHNLKQMMKQRDKALSKYKRTKSTDDHTYYKQMRNLVTNAVTKEKAAYLTFQQNNVNKKELWKSIKYLNMKKRTVTDIPNDLKHPNNLNDYFLSVFSPPNNCLDKTNFYKSNKHDNNFKFTFRLATIEEVKSEIYNLKSNAYGKDNICAKMLQLCLPAVCPYVTHIVNCCLETGYYPEMWKISLVKPLPKTANPQAYNELRPISILPTMSKIVERIINVQMYDYVTENNILSDLQSGFRKQYSTSTLLLNVTDNIIRDLDNGLATALILLDFSKAFDTLDHALLLSKLQYYGFDPISINFFESYLGNRRQQVVIDNTYSEIALVTSGVPQGSVLGPILFLIYTADIFNVVKYSEIQAFADDTQLSFSFKPHLVDIACTRINHDLESLSEYSRSHNLKLNTNKCNVIIFTPKRLENFVKMHLRLMIDDEPIRVVNSAKNLGVIFDCRLRFEEYVSLLVKKAYLALKLLYKNIKLIHFNLRKKLIESLVLPILNYGITLYYPCLDAITQCRLQKIQNCCCRFVFGLRKYDRVSAKIHQVGWLKLDNVYKYHMSVIVKRILSSSSPPYLREKISFRRDLHNVNVRHVDQISLPRFYSAIFSRSFTYNTAKIYNSLDDTLKNLPLNSFRKKVKQTLLASQS